MTIEAGVVARQIDDLANVGERLHQSTQRRLRSEFHPRASVADAGNQAAKTGWYRPRSLARNAPGSLLPEMSSWPSQSGFGKVRFPRGRGSDLRHSNSRQPSFKVRLPSNSSMPGSSGPRLDLAGLSDRNLEGVSRIFKPLKLDQYSATIGMNSRHERFDRDCSIKGGESLIESLENTQCCATIGMGLGIVDIEFDRFFVRGQCLFRAP